MSPTSLKKPGIYLFRPPLPVVACLDRELLILFSVAFPKVTGAVLYEPRSGAQDISTLLDLLLEKMRGELEISANQIAVKICGMSVPQPAVIRSASRWLAANALRIAAIDIGKLVKRRICLTTETGLLGVAYEEKEKKLGPPFLSLETAHSRREAIPHSNATEVLVLSNSRVKRALAKQAVEEIFGWKANAPSDPQKLALRRTTNEFRAAIVLLFDDVNVSLELLSWLEQVADRYPSTRFGWVSDSVVKPTTIFPLETLPGLKPESPTAFKQAIKRVTENPLAWPAAGTLAFRKPVRKRM